MLSRQGYNSIPLAAMERSADDLVVREYAHFGTELNILMNIRQCINGNHNVLNWNWLTMTKIKILIQKSVQSDLHFYEVQNQLKNTENAFILITYYLASICFKLLIENHSLWV